MTVEELIEALQALPPEARKKVVMFVNGDYDWDIDRVGYNLTRVELKP